MVRPGHGEMRSSLDNCSKENHSRKLVALFQIDDIQYITVLFKTLEVLDEKLGLIDQFLIVPSC